MKFTKFKALVLTAILTNCSYNTAHAAGLETQLSTASLESLSLQQQSQQTNSTAGATNQGNNQNINFNSESGPREHTVYSQAGVFAPALTTSQEACMGSTSGGVSTPWIGLSIGTTWSSEECKLIKTITMLWNTGDQETAYTLMCELPKVKAAREANGLDCIKDKPPVLPTKELPAPVFVEPKFEAPVPIEPPVAKYIEYHKETVIHTCPLKKKSKHKKQLNSLKRDHHAPQSVCSKN